MNFKSNYVTIILLAIAAIFLLTPISSYIKRWMSSNSIDIEERSLLTHEVYALQLEGINTSNLQLSQTKGKVVFLHYWGTWCRDCQLEMPYVEGLYKKFKDDLTFITIAYEKGGNYDKIMPYLKDHGYSIPVYKVQDSLHTSLQPTQFPTTFIIDKKGNLASKEEGATDWTSPEIVEKLEKLVQE